MSIDMIYSLVLPKIYDSIKEGRLTLARTIEANVSTLYEFYKRGSIKIDPSLSRGYIYGLTRMLLD